MSLNVWRELGALSKWKDPLGQVFLQNKVQYFGCVFNVCILVSGLRSITLSTVGSMAEPAVAPQPPPAR
jgi:hypothetical protein